MVIWADFYTKIFGFREIRYFDIDGKLTGLFSKAMKSPCGKIKIPLNESKDDKSQIEKFLNEFKANSTLGHPITINKAEDYIFGVCVVNDWSLRDIQAWEYQPLGPFTSKSVLTSVSPFVIPLEELEPFKVPLKKQDIKPFDYLDDKNAYTYDIKFDVKIRTEKSSDVYKVSEVNFKDIYRSMKQMIAQHTITGCNLRVGDLLASGTISSDGG